MVAKKRSAELPIRSRTTFDGAGDIDRAETVYCPARGTSVEIAACGECGHCDGHDHDKLTCNHPAALRSDKGARSMRMPSQAELTSLSEIMTRDVLCVTADLPVHAVGTLFLERQISAAPVVDRSGRVIGVVSKTDLVRWYHDEAQASGEVAADDVEPGLKSRAEPTEVVSDIMMPIAFTLTEDSPIAHGAALMAVEAVHHLPVVDTHGKVVGMLASLDLIRWIAQTDGYVVPPSARRA